MLARPFLIEVPFRVDGVSPESSCMAWGTLSSDGDIERESVLCRLTESGFLGSLVNFCCDVGHRWSYILFTVTSTPLRSFCGRMLVDMVWQGVLLTGFNGEA